MADKDDRAEQAETGDGNRADPVIEAILKLVEILSPDEKKRLFTELQQTSSSNEALKSGSILHAIVRKLPNKKEWTIAELKEIVLSRFTDAKPKEIYNAIGYLTRTRQIRRVGYGRYVVDGVEVVTSDDLGGETTRHEDEYRTSRE